MRDLANFVFVSTVSQLAVKKATSNSRRALPFSRNDLHSSVQPPVKAFGYQAMTTACLPLKLESL